MDMKYQHRNYNASLDANGKLHGLYESFWGNGKIHEREYYIHGLREGLSETYWHNGNLRYCGYFSRDKLAGFWTTYNFHQNLFWDKNKNITSQIYYL